MLWITRSADFEAVTRHDRSSYLNVLGNVLDS
jgi:hypothetical protein